MIERLITLFTLPLFAVLAVASCGTAKNAYAGDESLSLTAAESASDPACQDCNILFISLTSVRYDHLGLSGYSRKTSPHIDRFAKGAVTFDNAFTVASWTIPVINTLYASQYPFTHNVMTRFVGGETEAEGRIKRLTSRTSTLVDVLRAQGYTTASINGAQDFRPQHGITSRFDFNRSLTTDKESQWGRYGSMSDVAPTAVDWLEANRDEKFFLHLQAYDAHCPYAYPEENTMFDPAYRGKVDFTACYYNFDRARPIVLERNGVKKTYYSLLSEAATQDGLDSSGNRHRLEERDIAHMAALYDGEIHNMDAQLEQVFETLQRLKLMDKTIVVLFSEHGELFGKHGRFMRGGPLRGTFYDDVLHVPLILYHPKLPPKRIKSLVSLVDLAPTVLDLVGIAKPPVFQGQSFTSLFAREDPARKVFAGSLFKPSRAMRAKNFFRHTTVVTAVRNAQMKLIRETLIYDKDQIEVNYELYDLTQDPEELENIAPQDFAALEDLNEQLNAWLAETADLHRLLSADSDRDHH